jgi:hypothetical protein
MVLELPSELGSVLIEVLFVSHCMPAGSKASILSWACGQVHATHKACQYVSLGTSLCCAALRAVANLICAWGFGLLGAACP